jgi:hypothetical protein
MCDLVLDTIPYHFQHILFLPNESQPACFRKRRLKTYLSAGHQQHMLVILATGEAEIVRIVVLGQARQKSS